MRKGFYVKLAADNIKKNSKTYIPYILTCIITVAMFYIIKALSLNDGLNNMRGAAVISSILELGNYVVGFFAFIFLFYTNSFLMKRRKKDFGIFNILGMEKRHLSKVLALETLYVTAISLVLGLIIGIALDKVMYLSIIKILQADVTLGFYISTKAILTTLIFFGIIFLCIFLNSLRQIHLAKPIELLKSGKVGEKEPKTKWIMTIVGVICLGAGYYIAVTTQNPIAALELFFVAVILIIVGTYFLFVAGSVALLKILRKNKHYYYQTKHFTTISGMIYRMKQNAVGLANICILSTMVLVMISSTSSLMIGMEDVIHTRYPFDIAVYSEETEEEKNAQIIENIRQIMEKHDIRIQNEMQYSYLSFAAIQENNNYIIPKERELSDLNQLSEVFFITLDDYNKTYHTNCTLSDNEILIYSARKKMNDTTITVLDKTFDIKGKLNTSIANGALASNIANPVQIVVKDAETLYEMYEKQKALYQESPSSVEQFYGFDVNTNDDAQKVLYNEIRQMLEDGNFICQSECRASARENFMSLYGGLFFLGIFLGSLFIMATILIIYYKQISEGYDDKERFSIMQNVGMSHAEVKRSIHSQILTIFFLPLIMAGMHVAFTFPIVKRLLALLNLANTVLYIACTIGCFILFTIVYAVIYSLTAKTYYRIVSK